MYHIQCVYIQVLETMKPCIVLIFERPPIARVGINIFFNMLIRQRLNFENDHSKSISA